MEVKGWRFVGCPVAIEREAVGPAQEGYPHGLAERLRPFTFTKGQGHPFHPGGENGGESDAGYFITLLY